MSSEKFMRYGEVLAALEGHNIKRRETRTLIALNIIKGQPLREGGANYYRWSQIENDVLNYHAPPGKSFAVKQIHGANGKKRKPNGRAKTLGRKGE